MSAKEERERKKRSIQIRISKLKREKEMLKW